MLIRYADDFVVTFQYKNEAQEFYATLRQRLKKFNLDVAEDKTSIKRFSRFHPGQQRHFEFLGFRFYWELDFGGEPRLRRRTAPKKHKAALQYFTDWIKPNRHKRLERLIPMLKRKVVGFGNYFGLVDNSLSVGRVFDRILESLYKWLNHRSQRRSYTWSGMKTMLRHYGLGPIRVRKPIVPVDWY